MDANQCFILNANNFPSKLMHFDKQQYAYHHHQPSIDANQCLMSNVDNLPFEPLYFDK
jgi:hypothetical protein